MAEVTVRSELHAVVWKIEVAADGAVNALVVMILNMREEGIESGALYHAAHGLNLYRARVFGTPPPFVPLLPKR